MNELSALSDYHLTPAAMLTGLESLVLFVIGIRVARQRNRSSPALRRFSALILIAAATLGSLAMAYAAPNDAVANGWFHAALFFNPWVPLFVYALAATAARASRIPVFPLVLAGLLSIVGFRSSLLFDGFRDHWWGRYGRAEPGLYLLLAFWAVLLAAALVIVVRHRVAVTNADSTRRGNELLLILLAAGVGSLDFIAAYGPSFPPIGSLFFVVICVRAAIDHRVVERMFPVTIEVASEQVVEAMADAVIVVDAEGRIVVVNHALESMLGYSAAELRGESLSFLSPEQTEDTSRSDRIKAVMHGRTIRDVERVFRTRDGDAIPVSVSLAAMPGQESGIVLVVRDIRERKKAESEIRHTAALLRSILDSTHDAILVVGPDGTLLNWNNQLTELFGLETESITPETSAAALETILGKVRHPEVFVEAIMKAGASSGVVLPVVIELKDGRVLESESVPHRLDGTTIGRVWSLADVTEKRLAELALRASEKQYRLLFERNAAGVYRSGLDGTIFDCNDAYARMFGHVKASDLIGLNCGDFFFDSDERESLIDMLRDVGSLTGVELRLRRSDGREIWVMENLTIVNRSSSGPVVIEGTLVDISSLKIAEEQMEFQAYHDVLTVLPNRRLFIDRLTLALAHARRTSSSLAVMFLDLDHFKSVNDTMGHTAGDELLLAVAERLRGSIREEDTVARIGGDEFTILTSGLKEPQDALVVADKILASISSPVEVGGSEISVTASLGIAFYPDDGHEPEALLKSADSALYRAKELGRDNYQLCTPQLKVRASERIAVESELRESLKQNQLMLHYQPIVRLDTGEITAVEALVRWNHPKRGLVMPSAFMGVAEESRLSISLDMWVIDEACAQLRKWQDQGLGHLSMCVNLSGYQLQQKDLPRRIRAILATHEIASDQLELEFKENAILEGRDVGVPVLRELRESGVQIAIDDFGTGYSSLMSLKNLPIDSVKIDVSMVHNLPLNAGDAAIVSSIIDIARINHLRVVAEGVETAEQVRLLREKRCNEAQGHLFSAALPSKPLEEMLRSSGTAQPAIDVKSILSAKS